MKLTELGARFIQYVEDHGRIFHCEVDTFEESNGVRFHCPTCFVKQPLGVHSIVCWNPAVPMAAKPGPFRFAMAGTSLEDLTFAVPVQLFYGCRATFRVDKGEVVTCS